MFLQFYNIAEFYKSVIIMILYLVIDIVFYKKTLIQKQITFAIVSMQLFLYV